MASQSQPSSTRDHSLATRQAEPSAAVGYDLFDRYIDGYRGRWRYRVTIRRQGAALARLLFRRRSDAASYCAQSRAFGGVRAHELQVAGGNRWGEDFKFEGER